MDILDDILKELGIPYPARRIYCDLVTHGESTARLLSERLGMTRPSVYDQIHLLSEKGFITEREVEKKTYVAVNDVRHLETLLDERSKKIATERKLLSTTMPELIAQTESIEPKIKFYVGAEGVRQMLRDILWYDRIVIETLWPYEEMLSLLGAEFLVSFNERRVAQGITIRSVWPRAKTVERKGDIWEGSDKGVTRRSAPRGLTVRMGYTIYQDKVSFISSRGEAFGFIVRSNDFSVLMRMQFALLWDASKK